MASAGRILGERYRLGNVIARGGMAEVWIAEDTVLGRRVAVKVLHPGLTVDETQRERFRREALAAAKLNHPNIVSIYDTGEDGGTVYLVMEYVPGNTLRRVLDVEGSLPVERAVGITMQIADALEAAHQRGLVHRDVKPANVLIDDDARVKVTDFGIAKAVGGGGDLTRTGTIVGSARYLAPEQVTGSTTDARTDVYALALVAYEMLAGSPAFAGDTDLGSAVARVTADPPSLGERRGDVDARLVAAIERGFARDPADRWPSAAAFRDALGSTWGDAPTVVGDSGPPTEAVALRPGEDAATTRAAPAGPPAAATPIEPSVVEARLPRAAVAGVLAVLVAIVLVVGGFALWRDGGGAPADLETIEIVGGADFDPPPGDGVEHPQTVAQAFDGNPATGWRTETYATSDFGGTKDGVGLRLDLGQSREVRRVTVEVDRGPWSAEIYVADDPGDTLEGWGAPRAGGTDQPATATFELEQGAVGSSVLLWVTGLPEGGRLVVTGVQIAG